MSSFHDNDARRPGRLTAAVVALVVLAAIALVPLARGGDPWPARLLIDTNAEQLEAANDEAVRLRARNRTLLAKLGRRERQLVRSRRDGRRLYAANRWLARTQPPWGNHWLDRAFLCIHANEGAWNDPNAPYYGGLQMDSSFQRTYGPEFLRAFGTADRWPASVQIAVAVRAWLSRGFGPWPTRRFCGL